MTTPESVTIASPVATAPLAGHLPPGDHPSGLGGSSVTRLVRGLLRRGVQVRVVTLDREVAPGEEVVVRGDGLWLHVGPYRPGGRARDAFAVERASVRRGVEVAGGGVTHAHWSYEFALGALAVAPEALVTFRDWGPVVLRYTPDPYRLVRLGMQVRVLRRARHVTAVSPYLSRRVQRWTPRPVATIGNPIDEDHFGGDGRALRRARPRIYAVNAGWSRRKNVQGLIEAFGLLRDRRPDATLVLVGPGYGPEQTAHRWARRHGLASGVEFRGPVGQLEVLRLLDDADLLVHPSREETFGNVLLEAMAQRIPVLGGAHSGAVPWVLDDGAAGRLTDVDSPRAIATGMQEVLDDPDQWQVLADAGRERAWRTFRTEVVVASYLARYAELVRSAAR